MPRYVSIAVIVCSILVYYRSVGSGVCCGVFQSYQPNVSGAHELAAIVSYHRLGIDAHLHHIHFFIFY